MLLEEFPLPDYADQRYYNPWFGRFNTPDPSTGSNAADPASWNKYTYTRGDPVNRYDPRGLQDCIPQPGTDYCFSGGNTPPDPTPGPPGLGGVGGGAGGGGPDLPSLEAPPDFQWPGSPQEVATPWYQLHPCDTGDLTNARIIGFMKSEQADANAVAASTGLSADFILAWAASESGWGVASPAATQNNNFFGLKPALGKNEVHWAGSDPYSGCVIAGFDCFNSQPNGLAASGMSALTSFGGKYLNAALAAQAAGGSAAAIAQAIANADFNSEYGPGGYGNKVGGTAQLIQARKDCP